jgi:mannose-6-phosphate isomerase-like protein (cupin superfamily)
VVPRAIDLDEKFEAFQERWSPKVVARLNDYEIKLAKLEGEFVWHSHAETDELFFVLDGELTVEFREGPVRVAAGQMLVVPRGVEHRPIARGLVQAMLIEPSGVINTGDAGGKLTAEYDDSLT